MVVVPQLLQLVLASLHVVLCQTLQTFLLGLHHLADVSWEDKQIWTEDDITPNDFSNNKLNTNRFLPPNFSNMDCTSFLDIKRGNMPRLMALNTH